MSRGRVLCSLAYILAAPDDSRGGKARTGKGLICTGLTGKMRHTFRQKPLNRVRVDRRQTKFAIGRPIRRDHHAAFIEIEHELRAELAGRQNGRSRCIDTRQPDNAEKPRLFRRAQRLNVPMPMRDFAAAF